MMKNSDELRKAIERSKKSQTFAIAMLMGDSNYFVEWLLGQSGPTSHQGLAIKDAIENAGVRQDLTADEKELVSGIVAPAFVTAYTYGDNWKNKSAGTKAKSAKFFNEIADALKSNKNFSEIIVTYLDDEMLDQVKLVTDDNNMISQVAAWIVVRSVMIPMTPLAADAHDATSSEASNEAVVEPTTDDSNVVADAEYIEVSSEPTAVNGSTSNEKPVTVKNDVVDEHTEAVMTAYASMRTLGIPDEKIWDTLGIKAEPTTLPVPVTTRTKENKGGTMKASTSYKETKNGATNRSYVYDETKVASNASTDVDYDMISEYYSSANPSYESTDDSVSTASAVKTENNSNNPKDDDTILADLFDVNVVLAHTMRAAIDNLFR